MSEEYFYQELTCLADSEISPGFVMGKVMNQLHLGLVEISSQGRCPVGIGFPGYRAPSDRFQSDPSMLPDEIAANRIPIGNRIRVFGKDQATVESLGLGQRLDRLSDYVHLKSVQPLNRPIVGFSRFGRFQPNGNVQRMIRRRMKRKGETETQARQHFASYQQKECRLPYLDMHSASTDQRFRLYITKDKCDKPSDWSFTTYGLSNDCGVPDF